MATAFVGRGTRYSLPAFMRAAGIVHKLSSRSISPHRAPHQNAMRSKSGTPERVRQQLVGRAGSQRRLARAGMALPSDGLSPASGVPAGWTSDVHAIVQGSYPPSTHGLARSPTCAQSCREVWRRSPPSSSRSATSRPRHVPL
jgi:hypothetical protein